VALTTVVSVANSYFLVLESQDRLRIARDNLAAATRVYNLIKQRFDVGTASALDTAQQESVVNTQRASIPPLWRRRSRVRTMSNIRIPARPGRATRTSWIGMPRAAHAAFR
jgi:outer membrane protein TolC